MSNCSAQIFKASFIAIALMAGLDAVAAQAPNPRGGTVVNTSNNTAGARTDGRDVQRSATSSGAAAATVSRSAIRRSTATVNRAATTGAKVSNTNVSARSAATPRATAVTAKASVATHGAQGRAATSNVVRSATSATSARSAANTNVSRAASARATAVFEDISAIGGGYAQCREAYATCMDQFCAKANDTFRRCFCSSRYTEFRDIENALDQAKTMLMQFEDNNLNAVDKTASEVNAMYSATVGEAAIKKDTSASASVLSEIGDLLSGKKKATASNNSSNSLGIMSFDFTDVDDIWSGGGSSLFDTSAGQDLSQLEGQKLFDSANNQCLKIVAESCENNAVLTMARSSYNILISQDCNAYEKKINSQKEAVTQTVRQAEKMLRDARLEEYRAHNSADVNECLDKVKTALSQETACGANYKRCLDYSGVYIDVNTGEPIYSPRLFQLVEQINLNGSSDVLSQNAQFNQFLDSKKMFATTALDSCRDIADIVWTEFKRSALIEIAQAQDAKIEEVKMSCVSTMAECYDTQSSALKSFDNTTAKYSGAQAAYAARAMCQDKVAACAALYAGKNDVQCQFDNNGRLTNGDACGLKALVNFVSTVDNVRVAEGCAAALEGNLKEVCTPKKGDMGYPWDCHTSSRSGLETMVRGYAQTYCANPADGTLSADAEATIKNTLDDLYEELDYQLAEVCEEVDGYWLDPDAVMPAGASGTPLGAFYTNVFGGRQGSDELSWGRCVQNDVMTACAAFNIDGQEPIATYDRTRDTCVLSEEWYKERCEGQLHGYYENSVCYVVQ